MGDSFDLIRIVAAFLVLWSHQYAVTGIPEPVAPLLQNSLGNIGVAAFFALSGYLNAKSLLKRQSPLRFLAARALRIYPALIASILVTALYCAFATTQPGAEFNAAVVRFIVSNIFMFIRPVQIRLPGIFEGLPFPQLINASLWTIPIELICYAGLAIAMLRTRLFTITLAAGSAAMLAIEIAKPDLAFLGTWGTLVVEVTAAFCVGAMVATAIRSVPWIVAAVGISMLIGNYVLGWRILFALLIVAVGHIPLPSFIRPKHDISYGFYLYAFPCQQIAVSVAPAFWPSTLIAVALTLSLAWVSCLAIEEPALRQKSRIYAHRTLSPA